MRRLAYLLILLPSLALAEPGLESDVEYDSLNTPVFTTGAVVFGAAYGASAFISTDDGAGMSKLAIPLAGPWLALGDRPGCPAGSDVSDRACSHQTTTKILLITDGILQATGMVGMIDGILEPSSHRVRHALAQDTSLHVRPTVVSAEAPSAGVGVFARW